MELLAHLQEHDLAMQRTFCSFPPLGPDKYFDDGRAVAEYFWLPAERKYTALHPPAPPPPHLLPAEKTGAANGG